MGMTAAQILARTPRDIRESSQYVSIKDAKKQNTKYKTVIYKAKTYSTHNSAGIRKNASPVTYVSTAETNGKMVVVSCSCENFCFQWEYALNKKRAARIEYCNGEPPVEKNPRLVPGCCKHLHRFLTLLIQKGKVE